MRLKMIPLLIVLMGTVTARAEGEPASVAETPGAKAALAEINQLIKKNIPEEYRTPPAPLPDDQNAWTWWKQAVPLLAAIHKDEFLSLRDSIEKHPDQLTDEQIKWCEQRVEEQQPTWDMIERGIQAGRLRIPALLDLSNLNDLFLMRTAADLYLFQADRAMRRNDFPQAAAHLSKALAIGDLLACGENVLVTQLVGLAVQTITLQHIDKLTSQQTHQTLWGAMLKVVPQEEYLGQRVKLSLCTDVTAYMIPWLRQIAAQTASDQSMAVRVKAAEQCYPVQLMTLTEKQKQTLLQFLLEHTKACTPSFILEKEIPGTIAAIRQAEAPWDAAFFATDPPNPDAAGDGMKTLLDRVRAGQPLDPAQLREAIRLWETPSPGFSVKRVLLLDRRGVALRHIVRLKIAVRLFQLRTGQSPQSLGELVTHKILDKLPPDPFCDKPIRYDAKRMLLWSVGENGVDDNGEGHPDDTDAAKLYDGPDYVWRIAPPSR